MLGCKAPKKKPTTAAWQITIFQNKAKLHTNVFYVSSVLCVSSLPIFYFGYQSTTDFSSNFNLKKIVNFSFWIAFGKEPKKSN